MFVGRKDENSALTDHLYNALNGRGQVVFVSGEAGMGKTTLVEHWWKSISADFSKNRQWDEPVFAKSSCSIPVAGFNVGELEALQPFSDLLNSIYGGSANNEKRSGKISDILIEVAPDWLNAVPVVGKIAAAGVKTYSTYKKSKEKSPAKNTASSQQQVFQQYANFLSGLAEKVSSAVIWIDDLHWADNSSLNLLFYLAKHIQNKPVLVIASYRPEETAETLKKVKNEMVRYELASSINLNYFTGSEISQLLLKSIKNYNTNPKFEQWLLKISGGNALFLTNYLKTLTEDRFIAQDGSLIINFESLNPPDTVRAVIEERIRRLDEPVSDILRYATSEGEEFTTYIVSKLTGKGILEIIKTLRKAEELGIIKTLRSEEIYSKEKTTVYGFTHALFYYALYESLNEEEKNILHRQCYEVLKEEWDKSKDNVLLATKLLAHAEKCREFYTASEIGLKTAFRLWVRFAKDETLEILRKIINEYSEKVELMDAGRFENEFKPKVLGEAKYFYADVLSRTGNFNDAILAYKDAADTFEETGNTERRVYALNGVAFVLLRFNRQRESLHHSEYALKLSEEINSLGGKLYSLNHIADAKWGLGDTEGAQQILKQCIEMNKDSGDKLSQAFFYCALGSLYYYTGSHNEAAEYLNESVSISREIGSIKNEATSLAMLALIKAENNEFSEALEILYRSLEVQVTSGDRHAEAWTLNKIGQIKNNMGDYQAAIEVLRSSYDIFREINNPGEAAKSLMYMGNAYRQAGQNDESMKALQKSLQISETMENKLLKGLVLGEMAFTEEKRKKYDGSCRYLSEAISIFKGLSYPQTETYEKELERIKSLGSP